MKILIATDSSAFSRAAVETCCQLISTLITVAPDFPSLEALNLMRANNIGCLPVVQNKRLVGLFTAYDFLTVSAKLFEERVRDFEIKSEGAIAAS